MELECPCEEDSKGSLFPSSVSFETSLLSMGLVIEETAVDCSGTTLTSTPWPFSSCIN